MVSDPAAADESGVAHAGLLVAYADAIVQGPESEIAGARAAIVKAIGSEAAADAAAVIGNFERMNRIADATGIELDAPLRALSGGMREDLGINGFDSAANTKPTGGLMKLVSKLIFPLALKFYKPPMSGKK